MSEDGKLLPCRKCGAVPDILECDWTTPVTYNAACKCNLPDFFTREACAAHWNAENATLPRTDIAEVEKKHTAVIEALRYVFKDVPDDAEMLRRMEALGAAESAFQTTLRSLVDA